MGDRFGEGGDVRGGFGGGESAGGGEGAEGRFIGCAGRDMIEVNSINLGDFISSCWVFFSLKWMSKVLVWQVLSFKYVCLVACYAVCMYMLA